MTQEVENRCARLTVGQYDCQNQIRKGKCTALTGECSGRSHGIAADPTTAQLLIEEKRRTIATEHAAAVERLLQYRSTEEGLGHLSNKRALHAAQEPFR